MTIAYGLQSKLKIGKRKNSARKSCGNKVFTDDAPQPLNILDKLLTAPILNHSSINLIVPEKITLKK